jgi:hypothetical protein
MDCPWLPEFCLTPSHFDYGITEFTHSESLHTFGRSGKLKRQTRYILKRMIAHASV